METLRLGLRGDSSALPLMPPRLPEHLRGLTGGRPGRRAGAAACVQAAYEHYVERNGKVPGPMRDDYDEVIADARRDGRWTRGSIVAVLVVKEAAEGFLLDNIAVRARPAGHGAGPPPARSSRRRRRRAAGYDSIYLYTQEIMVENRALYERVGYVEYARRHELGLDRIYMRKQLTPGGDAQPRSPV